YPYSLAPEQNLTGYRPLNQVLRGTLAQVKRRSSRWPLLALASVACAHQVGERSPVKNMPADHSSDEAVIRKLEAEYDAAWNRGDTRALVSSFAPDAIVVNPYGLVATGRMEFEE